MFLGDQNSQNLNVVFDFYLFCRRKIQRCSLGVHASHSHWARRVFEREFSNRVAINDDDDLQERSQSGAFLRVAGSNYSEDFFLFFSFFSFSFLGCAVCEVGSIVPPNNRWCIIMWIDLRKYSEEKYFEILRVVSVIHSKHNSMLYHAFNARASDIPSAVC